MKTLRFSYNGDTVGVKVADDADLYTARRRAMLALDLDGPLWTILDESGEAVELRTKVKLFAEGYRFTIICTDTEGVPKAITNDRSTKLMRRPR